MKINITNKTKIQAALETAQKRCRARTVDHEDLLGMVKSIEKQLNSRLYKKYWRGIRFLLDYHGQSFPNAYNGTPESTQVVIVRGAAGWFLTSAFRATCNSMEIYPQNIDQFAEKLAAFVNDHKNWN